MYRCPMYCRILGGLLLLLVTGCYPYTTYDDIIGGIVPSLEQGRTAYVAQPADGEHAYTVYDGSGALVGRMFCEALQPYASTVRLGPAGQALAQSFAAADAAQADYLFVPEILQWAPGATVHSHTPVRLLISVRVYALPQRNTLLQRDITVTNYGLTLLTPPISTLAQSSINGFCRQLFSPPAETGAP